MFKRKSFQYDDNFVIKRKQCECETDLYYKIIYDDIIFFLKKNSLNTETQIFLSRLGEYIDFIDYSLEDIREIELETQNNVDIVDEIKFLIEDDDIYYFIAENLCSNLSQSSKNHYKYNDKLHVS